MQVSIFICRLYGMDYKPAIYFIQYSQQQLVTTLSYLFLVHHCRCTWQRRFHHTASSNFITSIQRSSWLCNCAVQISGLHQRPTLSQYMDTRNQASTWDGVSFTVGFIFPSTDVQHWTYKGSAICGLNISPAQLL